jgi:hypothetical protein
MSVEKTESGIPVKSNRYLPTIYEVTKESKAPMASVIKRSRGFCIKCKTSVCIIEPALNKFMKKLFTQKK